MTSDAHYSESPFLELLDTRLEEWSDGHARVALLVQRHHLNRAGVVHGGVLSTLIDHAGGFSGLYCTVPDHRRYGVTLSLNVNYLAQSGPSKIIATGERVSGGGRIFFTRSEVKTEDGLVLATGSGVYRYRSGSEKPEGIPSLVARDVEQ